MTETTKPLPIEAETPCAAPVSIPDRRISAAETTNLWGADRSALRVCDGKRSAAINAVRGAR